MNIRQLEETAKALVVRDEGLLAMDGSSGPRNARSSTTAKPSVSRRQMALSLSQFLKEHRPSLAFRRQDDRKQAQP